MNTYKVDISFDNDNDNDNDNDDDDDDDDVDIFSIIDIILLKKLNQFMTIPMNFFFEI